MHTDLNKSQFRINGEAGLPEDYPIPHGVDDLLFYVQRNLNKNTIVYALNKNPDGFINEDYPINVFWLRYSTDGSQGQLNNIQKKAFGYTARKITNNAFECKMTSFESLKFYVHLDNQKRSQVVTSINGHNCYLNNIYVYADEFGIFPQVKYIELFGTRCHNPFPEYQRIEL